MSKKMMLINATDDECRIAIVENNILEEMLIEHQSKEQLKGNIYKAVAVQIQNSLQAAFVDFGLEKHGFLPKNEINPVLYSTKGSSYRNSIQSRLRVGQAVMVQVAREAVDNKGAALTTNISLPGRFMVLMPNSDKGGVSRKIEDVVERERLKGFLSGIQSEEHAVIIRTAGVGRSLVELKKDYTILKRTWESIEKTFDNTNKPALVHEEDDVVIRTLRDYYSEDIEEIWVDHPETFQKSLEFMKDVAPRRQNDLKLFVNERSLFATYNIENQVEQLTSRSVALKSGGSIVIDQTEALVAIDVNSGRSNQERNNDDTAQRTNLEAAEEVLRQLRLRNLGGLIVIDFIDMDADNSRKKVEDVLNNGKSRDKAKLSFSEISKFGLMEMSRQRLSVGISRTVEGTCPICDGKGSIPTQLAATNLIIRCIREIAAKGNVLRIETELPLELANHLHNKRRESIMDLELEFGITIHLVANPTLAIFDESRIQTILKSKKSQVKMDSFPTPVKQEKGRKKGRKKEQIDPEESEIAEVNDSEIEEVKEVFPKPKVDKASERAKTVNKHEKKVAQSQMKPKESTSEKQQTNGRAPKKIVVPEYSETGLIDGCLFQNIKEFQDEELDEITKSFRNRLKGKIDNLPPMRINEKYLWRHKGEKDKLEESSVEMKDSQSEAKEKSTRREGRPQKKGPGTATKKQKESGDTKPAAKKAPKKPAAKKTTGAKPVAKKKTTGKAEKPAAKKQVAKNSVTEKTGKSVTKKPVAKKTGSRKTAASTAKKTQAKKGNTEK